MGKESEVQPVADPKAFVEELEARARALSDPETKYQYQLALKDVEFRVDQERAKELGLSFPVRSIDEAERALRAGVITPTRFTERGDETAHEVVEFDPTPVGYSGFAGCVTHSLAWTDRGIFNVGRYAAMSVAEFSRSWQWFIHQRIVTPDQVRELREVGLSTQEILGLAYGTVTGRVG